MTDRRIDLTPVSYEYGGQPFTGYLADGSQGRGSVPGILVAHEGGGLTDHPRERARMLAELGYVAFAMDIFGKPDMPLEEAKALVRNLLGNLPADKMLKHSFTRCFIPDEKCLICLFECC